MQKAYPVTFSSDPPMRLLIGFQQAFPDATPAWIVQAPGREMWIAAAVEPATDYTLMIADSHLRVTFSLRSAKFKTTIMQRPLPLWARYPAGVLLALWDAGLGISGMQAVFAGEEPPGPRYDYAVGMAVAALAYQLHEQPCTAETLVELVEAVRRDYVSG